MFIFKILQLLRETRIRIVEYSHSELYRLFVVNWTALSGISCISSVDSSPELGFLQRILCRATFAALISI